MKDFHPYALIFPPLADEDFKSLCANIKARGLVSPITLHKNGSVVEGRHREMACDKTGVTPVYETFEQSTADIAAGMSYEQSLLELVMSKNAHRRPLTEDQKLAVAVEYKKAFKTEADMAKKAGKATSTKIAAADRRSDTRAAKAAGVSGRSKVNAAEKILEVATPEDVQAVRTGKKTLKQIAPKQPKAEKPTICEANAAIHAVGFLQRDAKEFILSRSQFWPGRFARLP